MSNGDKLGFGCTTTNRHVKDTKDYKYHVYRLSNQNELASSDAPIELLDSDDEDTSQSNSNERANTSNTEDSEDECPSADEMDVKPDIHTLMRQVQEEMKIKEEVNWNCYEYDRQTRPREEETDPEPVDSVDLDQFDMESEIYVNEPPQKRQRHESIETVEPMHNNAQPDGWQAVLNDGSATENLNASVNVASEYQMSDTVLKEKVKLVVRSRGQQLATDMLLAAAQSKDKPKAPATVILPVATSSKTPNKPPSPEIPITYGDADYNAPVKSVEELENDFISEITKWKYKWINDKNLNPLQFTMNVRHLDTDFADLHTFQQFVFRMSPAKHGKL